MRDKHSRTGTGAWRFVPLSLETLSLGGRAAFTLLNVFTEFAISSGVVFNRVLMANASRDLPTTPGPPLCSKQVLLTQQVLLR